MIVDLSFLNNQNMPMEKLETTAKLKIASFRFKHSLLKKQNRQKTIYARKINICRRRFLKVDDGDVSFYLIFIDLDHIYMLLYWKSRFHWWLIDYHPVLVLQHNAPPSYQLALEPIIYNNSSRLVSWPLFSERFLGDAINL